MIASGVKFVNKGDPVAYPELTPDNSVVGSKVEIVVLDGGMESGKPSVCIRTDGNGVTMITETSARLFVTMAKAIEARYPNLME